MFHGLNPRYPRTEGYVSGYRIPTRLDAQLKEFSGKVGLSKLHLLEIAIQQLLSQSEDPLRGKLAGKGKNGDTLTLSSLVSDPEFEQFWSAYPSKVGKKDALKAWVKAKDKPAISVILQALAKAKGCDKWTKDKGQYIPNPTTWLNQGRWADQPIIDGHAGEYKCPHCPHLKFTDKKTFDTHNYCVHPKYEG